MSRRHGSHTARDAASALRASLAAALVLAASLLSGTGCGTAPAVKKGRLSPPAARPVGPGSLEPLPRPASAPPPSPSGLPGTKAPPPAPIPPPARVGGAGEVRVLLEGKRPSADLVGERIRLVDAERRLLGEWSGKVTISAEGGLLRVAGGSSVTGPVEGTGSPSLDVGGRRVTSPVRFHAKGGQLLAVAHLPIESYVAGVLAREAAPSFHPEALKAMAVAIRSYTVAGTAAPKAPEYDFLAGVEDQVFDGDHAVPRPFADAAERTAGTVLLRGGSVARAVYHSTCGGRTEGAADAWEKGSPWPPSVPCEDCRHSPAWRWVYRMGVDEALRVFRSLGMSVERNPRIEVKGHTATGRVSRLLLSGEGRTRERREAKASDFRRAAGYAKVRSLSFEVRPLPGGFMFSGRGYGHGAGLCQWGADGMARSGASFADILGRYYPGAVAGPAPR